MPVKVYAYSCRVLSGEDVVAEQISLAHRYYNKLVELKNAQRLERERLRRALCPKYDDAQAACEAAEKQVEEVVAAIRAENAKHRRKRATKEESQALKDAKEARKAASERRKLVRQATADNQALRAAYERLTVEYDGTPVEGSERRRGGKFKDARAACGVYWGTYLKVEAAVEQAEKKFGTLKFRRWDGYGQVAVQIQGGTTVNDMVLCNGKTAGLCRLGAVVKSRRDCRAIFMRVFGGEEHKSWCDLLATWSRDMPADAVIMGVSLVRKPRPPIRKKSGYVVEYDYSIQFTVRTQHQKPRAESGACGVDIGWRLMPDGAMRVACWADGKEHGELQLPAELLARWERSRKVESDRDRMWNEIIAKLTKYKDRPIINWLPEWFLEATKFMTQWRAKGKLVRLMDAWKDQRIPGDEDVFLACEAWRAEDVRLWQQSRFGVLKAEAERRRLYLLFAADLRKRYKTIAVEDCDLAEIARKSGPASNAFDLSRYYMRIAATGMLRQFLVNDGAVKVPAEDTTRTCHACGSVEDWDQAAELWHTCGACKLAWDQDYNAAMNLLAAALQVQTEAVEDAPKKYVGRWSKRKQKKKQAQAS